MIPVNVITGFLGVGKTTLIRHLLHEHPSDQRWAVLVNEFGEVGVDGGLLEDEDVAIEEVAGGCLCCVAAPAFTVGLNRLIREQRPDRILIEPSGLGHPAQVLSTLRSDIYRQILQIEATVCVMDARHLGSSRHREHPNFIDQIHLADILVANKADCYQESDEQAFLAFANTLPVKPSRLLITERGIMNPALLSLEPPADGQKRKALFPEAHAFLLQQHDHKPPAKPAGWTSYEGQSDSYHRLGWLIDEGYLFDQQKIASWLDGLTVERVKALIHGTDGWFSYNRSQDRACIEPTESLESTRLQLIDPHPLDAKKLDQSLREIARG